MSIQVRNKFQVPCAKCRSQVAVGKGTATLVSGKWRTVHDVCIPMPSGRAFGESSSDSDFHLAFFGIGAEPYGYDFGPDECNPNEGSK